MGNIRRGDGECVAIWNTSRILRQSSRIGITASIPSTRRPSRPSIPIVKASPPHPTDSPEEPHFSSFIQEGVIKGAHLHRAAVDLTAFQDHPCRRQVVRGLTVGSYGPPGPAHYEQLGQGQADHLFRFHFFVSMVLSSPQSFSSDGKSLAYQDLVRKSCANLFENGLTYCKCMSYIVCESPCKIGEVLQNATRTFAPKTECPVAEETATVCLSISYRKE